MILTNSGVLKLMQRIKSFIASQLNTKANSVHTHTISEIDDLSSLQMGGGYSKSEIDTLLNGKSDTGHTHTVSNITDFPTIPSKTSDLTNDSGFLTSHQDLSGYVPKSGGAVMTGADLGRINDTGALSLWGGSDHSGGAKIDLFGKDHSTYSGCAFIRTNDANNNVYQMALKPDGTLTWGSKNVAMQEDTVPRSGGPVITSNSLGRVNNTGNLDICGGTDFTTGAFIALRAKDSNITGQQGAALLSPRDNSNIKDMYLYPNGTWTWNGTACQVTSDQRLKQQITQIDNKLLDAWEDVTLCQFKYNDAVNEKGNDNARLHTGYVVQQIDEACQKHNIDISAYGLYCHEEYLQETEEVEVEQADGTKTKETKVIREASEHYSLRYTEVYAIECAYLRRENDKLKQQMQQYNESLSKLEERLKALEQTSK